MALGGARFSVTEIAVLVAVLATACAAVLRGDLRGSWRRAAFGRLDALVLALVLWGAVASVMAEYQREALREFRTVIAEPGLLYLLVRLTGQDRALRERLARVLFASGAGVALVALARYPGAAGVIEAEGVRRARGFFGSPNNLALVLERVFPLGVSLAAAGRGLRRGLYAGGAAVIAAAIALTWSRGAWLLGVPAGLLALAWLRGGRTRRYAGFAVIALLLALIPLSQVPRLASLLDFQQGTSFLRLRLWESTWSMIREHPWLGVGPDNFLYYYGDYILPGAEIERWLSHPHNIVLDVWVRLGLPGLLLSTGVLAGTLTALWRRWHGHTATMPAVIAGLLAGLAAMLAHGMIDSALFVPELAHWAAFAMAVLVSEVRTAPAGMPDPGAVPSG
jgi:O-antigen ligase